MDDGTTVPDHKNKFGVRKELVQIVGRAQGERVLVAEPGGRLAVFDDDVEDERGDGVVQHRVGQSGLLQTAHLDGRIVPLLTERQNARNHPGLFATSEERGEEIGRLGWISELFVLNEQFLLRS